MLKVVIFLSVSFLLLVTTSNAQSKNRKKPAKMTGNTKKLPSVPVNMSAQDIAESGSFEDSVYKNPALKISVMIPNDWNLLSEDMNKATLLKGSEKLSKIKVGRNRPSFDKSISNTRVLFQAIPLLGEPPANTAMISCGIEKASSKEVTVNDYVAQNKKLVLAGQEGTKLKKDIYQITVNEVNFIAFETEMEKNGIKISQTFMVTFRKNALLFFILTSYNDSFKQTMSDTVNTLRLEK
jgi:hypothetical protein